MMSTDVEHGMLSFSSLVASSFLACPLSVAFVFMVLERPEPEKEGMRWA